MPHLPDGRSPPRRVVLVGSLCALLACLIPVACHHDPPTADVTLAAAASLRSVLPAIAESYSRQHPGVHVIATYGASGDLKKQVLGGAPVDGVLFASAAPLADLIAAGRVNANATRTLATNRLVLIGPKGGSRPRPGPPAHDPLTFATLATLPPDGMIAIGDPGAVPAGQYARDYLQKLGSWDALKGRLLLGGDVGAVLAYARRGEVSAAIVYATETRGVDDVEILDEVKGPDAPHPVVVAATLLGAHRTDEAEAFFAFARGPEGQDILRGFGFGPP